MFEKYFSQDLSGYANHGLATLLSEENLYSFVQAVKIAAAELWDAQARGIRQLVIPSRGAYPFYKHALSAFLAIYGSGRNFHEFHTGMKKFLLPFTADIGENAGAVSSAQMRQFWVKVLHDFNNSVVSDHTRFYTSLVQQLGPRYGLNTADMLPSADFTNHAGNGFLFMDTAISGRAICEITDAFELFSISNYQVLLFVDENGERLKSEYKAKIKQQEMAGKLKLVHVKKIFSEDTTPLLNSGICSLVFPELIELAADRIPSFKPTAVAGAGLWFINSTARLYGLPINVAKSVVDIPVVNMIRRYDEDKAEMQRLIAYNMESAIEELQQVDIRSIATTRRIINRQLRGTPGRNDPFDISGSHVIRLSLPGTVMNGIIRSVYL